MIANRQKFYQFKQQTEEVNEVAENAEWFLEEEKVFKKYLNGLKTPGSSSAKKGKARKRVDSSDEEDYPTKKKTGNRQ